MHKYIAWNGAAPTTTALAKVTTGTSIKTMLQLATPSTRMIQLISWGYTLDAVPASAGVIELLQTDVGATITQHVAAGLMPLMAGATFPPSLLDISAVTKTGYTASAEGTVTATRVFDVCQVPPTAGSTDLQYDYEWMPDARPVIDLSKFLRVRALFGAAVSMTTYVVWDE
jgi:hypothetical protein